MKSSILGGGED